MLNLVLLIVLLPTITFGQLQAPPVLKATAMLNGVISSDSLGWATTALSENSDGNIAVSASGSISHGIFLLDNSFTPLFSSSSTNPPFKISYQAIGTLNSGNILYLGKRRFGLVTLDGILIGVKTDRNGIVIDSFDEDSVEYWIRHTLVKLIYTFDDHFYALGKSYKNDTTIGPVGLAGAISKIDSNGQIVWSKYVNPTKAYHVLEFYDAFLNNNNNSLTCLAYATNDSTNENDYRLIDLDSNGNLLSDKFLCLDTNFSHQGRRIYQTSDNNILITGYVELGEPRSYYGFLSKFTPSGDSIWTTYVQQDGYTILQDVCELPNGDLVACGQAYHKYTDSLGNPKENNDLYLAVFHKNGTLKKDYRWGTDFKDYLSKILLLRDGNIVVGGSTGMETTPDNTYIRGGEAYIAKIQTASLSTPRETNSTSSLSIYPNPSSETITVSGLTKGSYTIVNILGLEVAKDSTNEPVATVDVRSLPNGIYYFIEKRSGTPTRVPFVIAR